MAIAYYGRSSHLHHFFARYPVTLAGWEGLEWQSMRVLLGVRLYESGETELEFLYQARIHRVRDVRHSLCYVKDTNVLSAGIWAGAAGLSSTQLGFVGDGAAWLLNYHHQHGTRLGLRRVHLSRGTIRFASIDSRC